MKMKTWLPAVLAVVLGGVAAYLARNMLGKPSATQASTPKMMQIVVANDSLIVGQELRAENLSTSSIPTPLQPGDYCNRPADLVGRVLNTPMVKGQEIHLANLAPRGAAAGLASLVPAGMRAMTINVDEGNAQAGMLLPGCHVDVVATFPNGKKSISRTLIKNLLVQAVGQRLTSAKPEDGKEPPPFHTVTLIVTPRQSQTIDLIGQSGKMRLTLRGLTKNDDEADSGIVSVKDIELMDDDAPMSASARNPSTQPSDSEVARVNTLYEVQLISGDKTSKIQFPVNAPRTEADTTTMQEKVIPGSDGD